MHRVGPGVGAGRLRGGHGAHPPARAAGRVVCIGPGRSAQSYLRADTLGAAALGTGCDAIHPGYGFLSENSAFAALAREHGLAFVGPPPEVIELAGDKLRAREEAALAGLPVLGGGSPSEAQAPALPAAGQGGRRGWGTRDQAGPRRGRARRAAVPRAQRGGRRVRRRTRVPRALHRGGASHRGAGRGRRSRERSSHSASATARCSAAIRR